MIEVKVKKLSDTAIMPTYGSEKAAGMDLYADISQEYMSKNKSNDSFAFTLDKNGVYGMIIQPHSTAIIPTGLSIEIPDNCFGGIYARSGLASKQGLRPANCVGIVDSDYRGEVMVALHNDTQGIQKIENGQRIAQLIIQPYYTIDLIEVNNLSETDRGEGGFGSTGIK